MSGEGGYAEEWQKAPKTMRQEIKRRRFSFYHGTKKLLKKTGSTFLKASKKLLKTVTNTGKNKKDGTFNMLYNNGTNKQATDEEAKNYFNSFEDEFPQKRKFGRNK